MSTSHGSGLSPAEVARRDALVGQLAGPVTHEINNALGVIAMYADLLRGTFPVGTPQADDVQEILSAVRRAGEHSRWLNVFSTGSESTSAAAGAGMEAVVRRLAKVLKKYLEHGNLKLDLELHRTPPLTAAEGAARDLVFLLAADVRERMESGHVTVRTGEDEASARIVFAAEGVCAEQPCAEINTPGRRAEDRFSVIGLTARLGGRARELVEDGRIEWHITLPTEDPAREVSE